MPGPGAAQGPLGPCPPGLRWRSAAASLPGMGWRGLQGFRVASVALPPHASPPLRCFSGAHSGAQGRFSKASSLIRRGTRAEKSRKTKIKRRIFSRIFPALFYAAPFR
jgi:hypothetical protein